MEREGDSEPPLTSEELIEARTTVAGRDRIVWMNTLKELRSASPKDFLPEDWDGETI